MGAELHLRRMSSTAFAMSLLLPTISAMSILSVPEWLNPCYDSGASTRNENQSPTEWPETERLEKIGEYASNMNVLVVTLKNKIQLERYHNDREALDSYLNFNLEDLINNVTLESYGVVSTRTELKAFLISAYEQLSRLSVFIRQSKEDENQHSHRNRQSYAYDYMTIEYDQHGGLYHTLCAIKNRFFDVQNVQLDRSVKNSIKNINVPTLADNHANRQGRDWIILERLRKTSEVIASTLNRGNLELIPATV